MVDPFSLDLDELTLGEYAAIEEVTGMEYPEIFEKFLTLSGVTSPKFLLALTLVAGSREIEGYTLEDAAKVRFLDLDRSEEDGEEVEDGGSET